MKSVTIRDKKTGEVYLKVMRHKDGHYTIDQNYNISQVDIEVRDENNCKVIFTVK